MIRSQKLACSLLSRNDRTPLPGLRGIGDLDAVEARAGMSSMREKMVRLAARLMRTGPGWQIPLPLSREEQKRPAHRPTSAPELLSTALRIMEDDSQAAAMPASQIERTRSIGSERLPKQAQFLAGAAQDRPSVNALASGAGQDRSSKRAIDAVGRYADAIPVSAAATDRSDVVPKTGGSLLECWPRWQSGGAAGSVMPVAVATTGVSPVVAMPAAASAPPSTATSSAVAGSNMRAASMTARQVLGVRSMQSGVLPSALQSAAVVRERDFMQTSGRAVVGDTGFGPDQGQMIGYRAATGPGSAAIAARAWIPPLAPDARADMQHRVVPPAPLSRQRAPVGNASSYSGSAGAQPGQAFRNTDSSHGSGANMSRVVNLSGDVIIDGRRLGRLTASSQAREASLPARGPSRVNLRAVPVFSGTQIPG